jgi:hypothetical protein
MFCLRDYVTPEPLMPGISWRDLEFSWTLAQCQTHVGPINKWVPYGVPKIGHRFDKSVFFLYRKSPKTGALEGPLGTGFFTYRFTDDEHGKRAGTHYYGITNHHIAVALGASIIRINTIDGGTRDLPFEVEDWHWVPDGDDVCAVDIDVSNFQPGDLWDCIPEFTFIAKTEIARRGIGLGENAFMVGLFAPHHGGGKRNVISGRFGNVSMLYNEDTPIRTDVGFNRPAHVIDMHSRSGFSGLPVFVYRTAYDDLQENATKASAGRGGVVMIGGTENMFWGFIGIHSGQFQERVRVRSAPGARSESVEEEAASQKVIEVSAPIRDGDYLVMPSSMTVVVPSWRITELLNLEVFKMIRQQRDAERKVKKTNDEPPVASEASDLPATDANPTHREDFRRLLGAAARKPAQEDGT